jgi:hypothetical protein
VYISSQEIALASLGVAAAAVIVPSVSAAATNKNARRMARERFQVTQRAKTYAAMLEAIDGSREGGVDAALYRMSGRLSVRMKIYASAEVHQAWTNYVLATSHYEKALRGEPDAGSPVEVFETWEEVRDRLVGYIRADLGTPGRYMLREVERVHEQPDPPKRGFNWK